jgi:hypothetical protein
MTAVIIELMNDILASRRDRARQHRFGPERQIINHRTGDAQMPAVSVLNLSFGTYSRIAVRLGIRSACRGLPDPVAKHPWP